MSALALLLLAVAPPPEGHFLVDETGRVSIAVVAQVDELAATIHVAEFGELMVLVTETSGKTPLQKLALDTFAFWPVGHAENVDGALLVIAARDKQATLVLGDSYVDIDGGDVDSLVSTPIKKLLEEDKLDDAVLTGTRAVFALLEKNHPAPPAPQPAEPTTAAKEPAPVQRPPEAKAAPAADDTDVRLPLLILGGLVLAGVLLWAVRRRSDRDAGP